MFFYTTQLLFGTKEIEDERWFLAMKETQPDITSKS